jgi:hypothetical protein
MPFPGEVCDVAGIYHCSQCDKNVVVAKGWKFPTDCNQDGCEFVLVSKPLEVKWPSERSLDDSGDEPTV